MGSVEQLLLHRDATTDAQQPRDAWIIFCPSLLPRELESCHSLLLKGAPWISAAPVHLWISAPPPNIQEPALQLWPTVVEPPPASLEQLLTEAYDPAENSSCCRQRPESLLSPSSAGLLGSTLTSLQWLSRKEVFLVPLGIVLCCRLCLSSGGKCPASQHCWVKWCF